MSAAPGSQVQLRLAALAAPMVVRQAVYPILMAAAAVVVLPISEQVEPL